MLLRLKCRRLFEEIVDMKPYLLCKFSESNATFDLFNRFLIGTLLVIFTLEFNPQ